MEISAFRSFGALSYAVESTRLLLAFVFAILVEDRVVRWLGIEFVFLAPSAVLSSSSVRLPIGVGIFIVVAIPTCLLIMMCISLVLLGSLLSSPGVVVMLLYGCSMVLVDSIAGRQVALDLLSDVGIWRAGRSGIAC